LGQEDDSESKKDYDDHLTQDQYFALVDARMERIGKSLKARWVRGELKKGRCYLSKRDFVKEREEELDDAIAYDVIEEEKQRRLRAAGVLS